MEPLDDGYLCIYSAACDGGGYAFRKRAQRPRARKKKRKERAKEEGDVNRCVDEIGGGDDGNKLSISNFARFSQRGNTIITILLRREFLICKEENHQSLACDFNFLNLGVKFIWNRKLKICGNDRWSDGRRSLSLLFYYYIRRAFHGQPRLSRFAHRETRGWTFDITPRSMCAYVRTWTSNRANLHKRIARSVRVQFEETRVPIVKCHYTSGVCRWKNVVNKFTRVEMGELRFS